MDSNARIAQAARAYEAFAPAYDLLTHDYEYGPWLTNVPTVPRLLLIGEPNQ